MPVRQWLNREKLEKTAIRQRVNARTKAMTTGRWELARPLTPLTAEQQLERIFDRVIILCRENHPGAALEYRPGGFACMGIHRTCKAGILYQGIIGCTVYQG
ncbi:MAG: hypothetical protein WCD89_00540 [Anaerocolumna sp.]